MNEFELLVLSKIDDVHARVNEVHDRIDEIGKKQAAHEIHIETLMGNGQPGKIKLIEDKLSVLETDKSERKGMGKLGKIAWAAIVAILGSDFLAHATEIVKKLATVSTAR